MANRPANFSLADLARALKAARAAELPVAGYEISLDGTIKVWTTEAAAKAAKSGSSWDDV